MFDGMQCSNVENQMLNLNIGLLHVTQGFCLQTPSFADIALRSATRGYPGVGGRQPDQ
jgi:hypothetical protein